MSEKSEAVVRSFVAALAGGDNDAILSFLTPDASYAVNAWHAPVVGHAAIRAELERQATLYTGLQLEILHIASSDTTVFTERIDSMVIAGKPITTHFASAFDVDTDLAITAIRDYYDLKEIEAQMP
jgi:limonene-1,2-epoxide hydrolase